MTEVTRMAIALIVLGKLREAIEANGNRYHGGLVPNLTSVSDVLTLPADILTEQVKMYPELMPTLEQVEELQRMQLPSGAG